jgi:hypothetical protein
MSSKQFSLVKKSVQETISLIQDYLKLEEEIDNKFPGSVCALYQYWYDLNKHRICFDGFWANYDDVSVLERMQVFHMEVIFDHNINLYAEIRVDGIDGAHVWDGNSWSKYIITEEDDQDELEMFFDIIEQKPQRIEMPCYFCKKLNDKDVSLCWNCGCNNPTK